MTAQNVAPRNCRQCKKLTFSFYPSRIKRRDWICKKCIHENRKKYVGSTKYKQRIEQAGIYGHLQLPQSTEES